MKRQSLLNIHRHTGQSKIIKYCEVETKSTNVDWSVTFLKFSIIFVFVFIPYRL